jgi:hypothetical protein
MIEKVSSSIDPRRRPVRLATPLEQAMLYLPAANAGRSPMAVSGH